MIIKMMTAIAVILVLLCGWLAVQHLARLFAKKHPGFGPAREEGQGCGATCGCHGKGSCEKQHVLQNHFETR